MPRAKTAPVLPASPLNGLGTGVDPLAGASSLLPKRPWPWPTLVRGSVGLHAAAAGAAVLWPGAWPWALAAVAINHGVLSTAGLWPRGDWLGPNVTRLPAAALAQQQVAITLDDGPDPEVTPAVLDLLAEHHTQVTFFCIADQARSHPALLRRMVAAGHSVQNHSLAHHHHFALLGPQALAQQVGQAQAVLADITGVLPHCFRAPAGLRSPLLDPVLHHAGLHLVSWSRRGYDTRRRDPQQVLQRLNHGLAAGAILLLHDGHAQRTTAGRPVLMDVLPPLLARCQSLGLQPVTLSEALPHRHQPT
jgi:peptidoglycan/xylan/chitin deacetylase (PgdA/CDA1 family)